jgi:dihydrofolate reductase
MTAARAGRVSGHVFIGASLDGYIARGDGDITWLHRQAAEGEDHGYAAFLDGMDGIVMGRGTFERALTFETWPYRKPVVVLSRTLTSRDLRPGLADKVRISREPPVAIMKTLATEGWKCAYVDGGKVIASFLREGLIADLVLTRLPVLLGDGIPLFGSLANDIELRHIGTTTYPSGFVQSKYQVL